MTVLEALEKFALAAPRLIAFLESLGDRFPDLKPETDARISEVQVALANLVALRSTLIGELADIGQLKFNPADHPSDAG